MDTLRVRVYNVHFGDAILISVPERSPNTTTVTRHILIDFGNVLRGKNQGGDDAVFEPVIDDIIKVLDGRPLDLYVMTHEHMDHIQGLLYASTKLNKQLAAASAWLTASSAENYYTEHPESREQHLALQKAYEQISRFCMAASDAEDALGMQAALFDALMFNNNPQSTADCVGYLRKLAANTAYVHRTADLQGTHPFQEARLRIWAPEENTSVYYRRLQPMALGVAAVPEAKPSFVELIPPPGVDASVFYRLVEQRRRGYVDNLLAIDRAANNTSIVFCLEWRGWKLLFAGDAELGSWRMMDKQGMLEPVHFLKVGHHGSHNGTPPPELLEKLMPMQPHDDRQRSAAISTWIKVYNDVPDKETREELRRRCQVRSIDEDLEQEAFYLDFTFEG